MGHNTLIEGTCYEVISGKTQISGTAYKINDSKTKIGGTTYDVPFETIEPYFIYNGGSSVLVGTISYQAYSRTFQQIGSTISVVDTALLASGVSTYATIKNGNIYLFSETNVVAGTTGKQYNAYVYIKNIDVTNYKKLHFSISGSPVYISIGSAMQRAGCIGDNVIFDVSSLSGTYRIQIHLDVGNSLTKATATTNIPKIWFT